MKDNKLIAEFMVKGTDEELVLQRDLKKAGTVESMHYHDSWDWLMPVVEKIEYKIEPEIRFITYPDECYVQQLNLEDGEFKNLFIIGDEGKGRLSIMYRAVVEFIKWYNNKK